MSQWSTVQRHLPTLSLLSQNQISQQQRQALLAKSSGELIHLVCFLLRGLVNQPVHAWSPAKRRQLLKCLAKNLESLKILTHKKKPPVRIAKRELLKTGGFLPFLIGSALSVLPKLLSGLFKP